MFCSSYSDVTQKVDNGNSIPAKTKVQLINGALPVNNQSKSKRDALPNAIRMGGLPESFGNLHAEIQCNIFKVHILLKHLEVPCDILDVQKPARKLDKYSRSLLVTVDSALSRRKFVPL